VASTGLIVTTTVIAVLALFASPGFAVMMRSMPSTRDFNRVQAANRAALAKLGLVDIRDCDRTNLICIDRATTAEAAAFGRAVSVEREIAKGLTAGNCRTAMLNRARANAKHRADVLRAQTAWHASQFVTAARYYYADYAQGGRFNGLFLRYC
jgi:hypothetical protein